MHELNASRVDCQRSDARISRGFAVGMGNSRQKEEEAFVWSYYRLWAILGFPALP